MLSQVVNSDVGEVMGNLLVTRVVIADFYCRNVHGVA